MHKFYNFYSHCYWDSGSDSDFQNAQLPRIESKKIKVLSKLK